MDGIINVYKEKGYTSHDVVAKLRGILHQKKIGHTGTLDPNATGVLPVCIGRGTKVCKLLTDKRKTYVAVVRLGVVTDTQDMTGTVICEHPVEVTLEQIQAVIQEFIGEIWQIPPMYSAVKVNGKRLYELARQGIEIERKEREITIESCKLLEHNLEQHEFKIEVRCSKGTYIRTLCHDMGERLGCGACMASLIRTEVEPFSIDKARKLQEIQEYFQSGRIHEILLPVEEVFESYPEVVVGDRGLRFLKNGNELKVADCHMASPLSHGDLVKMYDQERRFYAVYQYDSGRQVLKSHKMFFVHD